MSLLTNAQEFFDCVCDSHPGDLIKDTLKRKSQVGMVRLVDELVAIRVAFTFLARYAVGDDPVQTVA